MKRKSGLSKFNIFLCVVLVLCIAATAYVIKTYPKNIGMVEEEGNAGDVSVLETSFEAGTYGGVEFGSPEDVVNYYVKSFNYTKTLTAEYKENGETKTYYKLLADEDLKVENLLVEGKSSDIVNKLVPSILGQLFAGSPKGIPPAANRDRNLDERDDGPDGSKIPQQESHLTAEDVLDCNVEEVDAHTIKITIQPKGVVLSMADQDAQGRFFNVLGDISSTVNSISVLSFSEGTIEENFVVNYQGGTGVVTIDTTTGEIIEADYTMKVHIDVKHANVAVLKNKNASLDIVYTNHAPASDEFLLSSRNITR
jgi:hypothetical protein